MVHRELPVTQTPWGSITYLPKDGPIGVSLDRLGAWAACEIRFLRSLIGPGATVIDVGANIGTHAIALAGRIGPKGSLIAFEPQSFIAEILERNISANHLSNCQVVRSAAGNKDDVAWIGEQSFFSQANIAAVPLRKETYSKGGETRVKTIDALSLSQCDLIKIDAEGMGAEVLQGAIDTLRHCQPIIYLEANNLEHAIPAVMQLDRDVYEFFVVTSPAQVGSADDVFGFATETSILALPKALRKTLVDTGSECQIQPFSTLDQLADAVLKAPRFGDPDKFFRNAEAVRQHYQALVDSSKIENEHLNSELTRARYREALYYNQLTSLKAKVEAGAYLGVQSTGRLRSEESRASEAEKQVVELRNSTSWLVTAPMRWVAIISRKLLEKLRG
ncbi:FkbM family methyltransferase [Tianweitania sp. BSSL-BM11]|uniref:FkbM family methyltransferase n=1 Tax=Tianweitania aestuarii TaxID=2814886 RepID=A0ABS5RQZ9_9HYPH|nr:FkbM family methyltransferase [Tianweitania aestuarii]MBS9719404.1 FkbM family methyltransferase [Tianweitania aestuarii]